MALEQQMHAPSPAQLAPGRPHNGLGLTALGLGLLAVLTSVSVLGGLWCGAAALVLGAMSSNRIAAGEATNRAVTRVGVLLGLLGVVLSAGVLLELLLRVAQP
ncbi:hypothetical protein CLV35_1678 [Motilibacter peucedani]|uniref:DUF4190 domain-containing protein n=1 Tax=Motilibacter peucedani TaxID=598650 RepID=A0A420XPM5_9ACTN|nr:hypothetical protein [Motilibacter peucedani]RKS75219.1 hypothetical protein CLV35_1678 [Motilibacter peucedani]